MDRTSVVRSLVLSAASAVLIAASIVPAHAGREVMEDGTRDVWSPDPPNGFTYEGSAPNTDLTSVVVRHRTRSILVEADYKRLKRRVSDEIHFEAFFRTDESRRYGLTASVDPNGQGTSYYLWQGVNRIPVECRQAIGGRTRFTQDELRVRIPRVCVGSPRWVRYQALADSYEESSGLFLDSATGPGPRLKRWSKRVRRG